jgi:hypothetical protein
MRTIIISAILALLAGCGIPDEEQYTIDEKINDNSTGIYFLSTNSEHYIM